MENLLWWLIGALVFCFLMILFLALAAAGEKTSPEEEMRLLFEQEKARKKAEAMKMARKAQRRRVNEHD